MPDPHNPTSWQEAALAFMSAALVTLVTIWRRTKLRNIRISLVADEQEKSEDKAKADDEEERRQLDYGRRLEDMRKVLDKHLREAEPMMKRFPGMEIEMRYMKSEVKALRTSQAASEARILNAIGDQSDDLKARLGRIEDHLMGEHKK